MSESTVLPQLGGEVFLTDGGIETDLIFHHGLELPEFASFVLYGNSETEALIDGYFREYLRIGSTFGRGLVLETATWRASADWGERLGYGASELHATNRRAVSMLRGLRDREADSTVVISGCIGPRGDAYSGLGSMDAQEAQRYHSPQVEALAAEGADMVGAYTLTNATEAIGIVNAASACSIPVAVSFTVETDGALPNGMSLGSAIATVDEATDGAADYFLVNCAHPDHFGDALAGAHPSLERVRGVRANASRLSHAELDESETLDDGDPAEFAEQLLDLHRRLPQITILGGCCGTDHRHIEQVAATASIA